MPKSHRQIWLEIAEAFGTPYDERTDRQKEATRFGLCYAYHITSDGNGPRYGIVKKLKAFSSDATLFGSAWFCCRGAMSFTPASDSLRCLYACQFATWTERKFNEVCR